MASVYQYYRTQLSAAERSVYDAFAAGVQNRSERIRIPQVDKHSLHKIHVALENDNPQLFWIPKDLQYEYGTAGYFLLPKYHYSVSQIRQLQSLVSREASRILNSASGRNDVQIALGLHDALVRTVTYGGSGDSAHNIIGPLAEKRCVCEGFADCFKLLCDYAGIQCMSVSGEGWEPGFKSGGPHAWNILRLGGRWYQADVTFDHLLEGHPSRAYFGMSTREIRVNHTFSREFAVPDCPADIGLLPTASDTGAIRSFLKQTAQRGGFAEIRLNGRLSMADLKKLVDAEMHSDNRTWGGKRIQYWFKDDELTVSVLVR